MRKFYNIILLLSISVVCFSQTTKKELIIEIIKKATDFNDLEPVIDIIKNEKSVYVCIPSIHPIAAGNKPYITSTFGSRIDPVYGGKAFHAGIDFKAQFATSIHATAKGKVIFAGINGGYGKCVFIEHDCGFITIYAHMTAYYTKKEAEVNKGDIIGFLGSTGKSTGVHLHYEIRKNNKAINPIKFLQL